MADINKFDSDRCNKGRIRINTIRYRSVPLNWLCMDCVKAIITITHSIFCPNSFNIIIIIYIVQLAKVAIESTPSQSHYVVLSSTGSCVVWKLSICDTFGDDCKVLEPNADALLLMAVDDGEKNVYALRLSQPSNVAFSVALAIDSDPRKMDKIKQRLCSDSKSWFKLFMLLGKWIPKDERSKYKYRLALLYHV